MEQNQPARLEDIISYTPETYLSEEEIGIVRSLFNGPQGAKVLKVIRKVLLPSISDPDLPVEELSKDIFMSAVDFRTMQESEVKPTVLGLQIAVKVIAGSLMNLKSIANIKEETPQEVAARQAKNSSK